MNTHTQTQLIPSKIEIVPLILEDHTILKEVVISEKRLQSDDIHAYCPYCTERAMRNVLISWREGSTVLFKRKIKLAIKPFNKNFIKATYEDRYYCPECKIYLTYEDMKKFWFDDSKSAKTGVYTLDEMSQEEILERYF